MAVSAISQIALDTIVLEGTAKLDKESGKLAGAYKPGQLVYESAKNTWTATAGTAALNNARIGVVEFKRRTGSDFAYKDIDDAYTTKDNVEIITGPRDGSVKLAMLCLDLSADKYYGHPLYASSGGKLDNHADMLSASIVASITDEGYTNGSTVLKGWLE